MSATPSKPRGRCRVCRGVYQLRNDGKIRGHMCDGGGLPPLSLNEERVQTSALWVYKCAEATLKASRQPLATPGGLTVAGGIHALEMATESLRELVAEVKAKP